MKYSGAVKNDHYENYRATGEKASVLMHNDSTEYKLWPWEAPTECPALCLGRRDSQDAIPAPLEAPGSIA